LANLADNLDNKVAVAKAGGIKAVITAMRNHASHAGVQHYGCRALTSIAYKNWDNKVAVAKAGGIEAIITAMRNHASHAGVQHWGCKACNLMHHQFTN